MSKCKKWLTFSALLAISIVFASNLFTEKVDAATSYDIMCNPTAERKAEIDTPAKLEAYLDSIDVPYSVYVSKAGKWLDANWTYAYNRCIIVYGTPQDVVTEARKENVPGSNGEWLYLGYTKKGIIFPNPDYPPLSNATDYVKTSDFIINPWDNASLQADIAASPKKPYTIRPGTVNPTYRAPGTTKPKTPEQELDRTIDDFYVKGCGSNCSRGNRGYFTATNDHTGTTLVGSNLVKYASVAAFAEEYSAGIIDLYRVVSPGVYRFASFYLPPYKSIGMEVRDLSIKINSISPSSLIEGNNYTVNYTICNQGEIPVKNPVINYGDNSSQTGSRTISTTLDELECYTGNISATAHSVSSDTAETYYMSVNKADTNPKGEDDRSDNTATKPFTIINRVVDLSIGNITWTPQYPHSNEQIDVSYQVCNNSNVPITNVAYKIGFIGTQVNKSISNMTTGQCIPYTITLTTPVVKDYTGPKTLEGAITSSQYFSEDVNSGNNKQTKTVTVRNPDVFTDIIIDNDSSNNTVGDVKVKVENRTWNTIKEDCSVTAGSCLTGSLNRIYNVSVYDTKFTATTSDDVLIQNFTPTYSLIYAEKNYFPIDRSLFTDWVQANYPNTYQLVQFRIASQIPDYGKEVDWFGAAQYDNNRDEDIINYFPDRPRVAFTQCNEIEHTIGSYFTISGGFNPIKICAGHYPTYPSTTVESGMQAYHYVLYRFFAQPMPKYTVTTPESDVSNPNHFSQIYSLPATENYNQMGDFESMFVPNKKSNGYYQERGRYMPTGGTFNFEVYKKNSNGTKGQQIALGTVSYNIPGTCYDHYRLDINHQYACDEIMFFLPNPDIASKKHEKPSSYSSPNVSYPISGTKIPYLNPGKYTFTFKATENFRYYYQTNLINTGYNWAKPKFK